MCSWLRGPLCQSTRVSQQVKIWLVTKVPRCYLAALSLFETSCVTSWLWYVNSAQPGLEVLIRPSHHLSSRFSFTLSLSLVLSEYYYSTTPRRTANRLNQHTDFGIGFVGKHFSNINAHKMPECFTYLKVWVRRHQENMIQEVMW